MTGKKKYRLSYVYNIGNDSSKEYDEFYYNLIGYEWDTTISNISFNIKMPKEFDTSKIEFYSGEVGSTSSSNITYSTDGKSVYGTFNGTLNPGNALTIRIEMPEGYYVKQKVDIDNIKSNAISMLSIIFAFISFILWVKYGKDEKVTKEIQFFPPEGLNSLEVALFYKGKVDNNDVISLLIYLANKGYIKLVEPTDDKDLKIISQKEYDGDNQNEALFLDGLFKDKYGNKITIANKKTLINNFYKTIKKIKKDMNSKYYAEKIYEKSSLNCKKIVLLMISVLSIIIFISRIEISPILFMFILTSCILYTNAFKSPKSIKSIIVIIFVLQFTLPPLISYFLFLFLDLNYLIAIICLIIMITFYFIMPKRNAYGKEMFRKILSFKEFLETCGDLQLEVLLKSYPNYLNDMLAYSYAFGFSNEWVKYFNTFSLTEPKWYIGRKPRNSLNSFTNIFNTTLNSTTKSMSSNPLSDGGGSSGRGSSGGGSGGGGGGSW